MLKIKQNPKLDFQRYTKFLTSMSDVVNQRCTTSIQSFFNVVQCRFNDMTLSELCLNLESTSVKALSKPVLTSERYAFAERLFVCVYGLSSYLKMQL